ncbi:hypothetical protein EON66_05240 [archaeon]|nr:MAG: hypothetical protein EON66_05240 [archaeon]
MCMCACAASAPACCCRYAHDTRYSEDSVASHDRQLLPAFPCVKLEQVMGAIGDYDVIAIDEVRRRVAAA